jgi:hypothetical protein
MGVILAEPAHSRTNSRTTARAAPHARGRARDRRWTRAPDNNARPVMPARRPHRLALSAAVTTPGSVTVHRSYKDITVACEAAGQPAGSMAVKSSTKAMAFGNVIAGGVIGAGIDMANGAAYDYPDLLTLTMGRVDGPPSAPPAPAAPAAIVPAQAAAPAPAVASVRPAGVRHLQAGSMEGATWTYTTGTAWLYKSGGGWNADSRMEFHGGRVQASNTRLRGDGTYTVADDKLCVNIDSKLWGKACYYVIEAAAGDDEDSGHGLQLRIE